MKLLRVKTSGFKNCGENFTIDFTARSKKTSEDKEYELQEVADGLYVFNTAAFVGKNASGKTTAMELLDCCYALLGEFRLDNMHFADKTITLEIMFYHDGCIYKYVTRMRSDNALGNKAIFEEQHIYKKKYYKSNACSVFATEGFDELKDLGELPEDTSILFFVLKKKQTVALYFDSFDAGADTYPLIFRAMQNYRLQSDMLLSVIHLFDEHIQRLEIIDEHNYRLTYGNEIKHVTDKELFYLLSSGTTKGALLYVLMAASLQHGFDLLVDEIENHFHKTLVENMISLYKDKQVNRHNASLIFSTHYCELLDLFNRQDNIWICKAENRVELYNMYDDFHVRSELLKSRQFYNDAFKTAVNYEELMNLKRKLMR